MRPRFLRRLTGALALAAALPASAQSPCGVAMLRGLGVPPEQLLPCVRTVAANPAAVDGELLRAALGALDVASFTRPAADEPDLARRLLAELKRRGALGPDDHERLRSILLANGRLDEVAADRVAHPAAGEQPLPARRPLARPPAPGEGRYWRWDAHGTTLIEQSVDLAHGLHLVIDASPSCPFCAQAVAEAEHDPTLARVFEGALWIARPEQDLASANWMHWNDAHPTSPMVLVLDTQGWDLPPLWSTPQFRFFRDGRVVASVLGWTPKSRAALLQAGREQGLLAE